MYHAWQWLNASIATQNGMQAALYMCALPSPCEIDTARSPSSFDLEHELPAGRN